MAKNQRKILRSSTINITGNVNDSNIHIGDTISTGYSSEEVSALIKQISSTFQVKSFDGTCPYKGLDYFEEEDADLFFGREKLVDELVGKVKNSRTVFITGPSGSGKSSLVRAGFIHALKQGQVKGSERWLYATMKPGRDPFEALAIAFSRLKSPELGNYFRQNRNNPGVFHECAESTLGESKNQRLVLFMDQFEEVFTQVSREEERTTFLNLLTHAANIENGRVTLLFAMRSDFVPNCAVYPDLNALLNKQFIQIGSMQPEELVSAIAQPALRVGLKIESELIAQIINDMKGEPGALPLMSFALKDLFDKEKNKGGLIALTLNGYFKNKGINEALQRHADSALAQFSEHETKLAQSIFSNLIEIGRGTQDTKRTALFNELIPADSESDDVKAVVQKLADARLVTTEEGSDKYTITHEKLIDAWPWLKKLINANRNAITLQNEIASAAKEWEENKRDASYLYSGGRLVNIWEQVQRQKLALGQLAQEFVKAGRKRQQRARAALISAVSLVVIASIMASVLFQNQAKIAQTNANNAATAEYVAYFEKKSAEEQKKIALARQLAFQSQLLNLKYGTLAIQSGLLAVEAAKLSPTIETNQALHRYLVSSGLTELVLNQPASQDSSYPWSIAFSPDGEQIGIRQLDPNKNNIHVWDIASSKEIKDVTIADYPWLDPSIENLFVSQKDNGFIKLINRLTNEKIGEIETNGDVSHLVQTSDGSWLIVDICRENNLTMFFGCTKGNIHIWDTKNRIEVLDIAHDSTVGRIDISPDKKWIVATGCIDIYVCTIYIWDTATGKEMAKLPSEGTNLGISPDSRYIVSGNALNLRIWEVGSFKEIANKGLEGGQISFSGFSPNGYFYLWYEGINGENLNNLLIGYFHNNDFQYSTITHNENIYNYTISPPEIFENYIVTGSEDGTARLSEMWRGNEIAQSAFDDGVFSNAFSPNGKTIASISLNGEIHVWNTLRGGMMDISNDFNFEVPTASPSGRYFLVEDGVARHIIDKNTGEDVIPPLEFSGSNSYKPPIVFSNDENFIVFGLGKNIHVIQTLTGSESLSIPSETQIISVSINYDNQYIAWLENNNVYHVWSLEESKEVDRGSISQTLDDEILFSPDGKYILSKSSLSSDNSGIHVWVWKIEDLVSEVCKRVPRNFTRDEWKQYFPNEEYRKTCEQWPLEPETTP